MKLSTRAETLVSLLQLEYLSGSNRSSLVEERNALSSVCSFIWCDFRISASNTPLVSILFSGHYVGFCFRKAGPLYHLSSSARVDTLSPLVSKSNAFSLVGTHLHCSGLVDAWISPTSISHKMVEPALGSSKVRLCCQTRRPTYTRQCQAPVLQFVQV